MKQAKKTSLFFVLLLLVGFSTTNCANKKKILYFQNIDKDSLLAEVPQYQLKIKKGDFLDIKVAGADEETLLLFSFPTPALRENFSGVYRNDNPQTIGFEVDNEGLLIFPF